MSYNVDDLVNAIIKHVKINKTSMMINNKEVECYKLVPDKLYLHVRHNIKISEIFEGDCFYFVSLLNVNTKIPVQKLDDTFTIYFNNNFNVTFYNAYHKYKTQINNNYILYKNQNNNSNTFDSIAKSIENSKLTNKERNELIKILNNKECE